MYIGNLPFLEEISWNVVMEVLLFFIFINVSISSYAVFFAEGLLIPKVTFLGSETYQNLTL